MRNAPWMRAASWTAIGSRSMKSPSFSPECGPAPVTTVPRHDGERGERHARLAEAEDAGLDARPPRSLGLAGPMVEHGGVEDQEHRHDEVALHQPRVEVAEHDDPAEHDLGEDAGDEAPREQLEVAAPRDPPARRQHGHDHDRRHQPGDEPVDELDHRVQLERRDEALVGAARPVGAAQTRAGEADGGAGDDDEHQQAQGREGDPAVRGRGHGGAAHAEGHGTRVRPTSGPAPSHPRSAPLRGTDVPIRAGTFRERVGRRRRGSAARMCRFGRNVSRNALVGRR